MDYFPLPEDHKKGTVGDCRTYFFLIKNLAGHLLIDLPMQRDFYIFSKDIKI